MTEEKVIEVEIKKEEQDVADQIAEALGVVVDETVRLFTALGKAVVTTAQDVSNLMVIKVDAETRERLDVIVDAGVATNRREAVSTLIESGIKAEHQLFDKIAKTSAQIDELRKQIRTLMPG